MSPWLIFIFPILTQGWIGFQRTYFSPPPQSNSNLSPQDGDTYLENYANVETNSEDPEKVIDMQRNDPEELFKEGRKLYVKRKYLSEFFFSGQ